MPPGTAACLEFEFVADVRGGVELPGGVPGTMPHVECKDGVPVRTGVVTVPVPSRTWSLTPFGASKARLVDPDGPADGPMVILKPSEFLAMMDEGRYDHV